MIRAPVGDGRRPAARSRTLYKNADRRPVWAWGEQNDTSQKTIPFARSKCLIVFTLVDILPSERLFLGRRARKHAARSLFPTPKGVVDLGMHNSLFVPCLPHFTDRTRFA